MPGLENRIVVGDYLVIRDLHEVRMLLQQPLYKRLWPFTRLQMRFRGMSNSWEQTILPLSGTGSEIISHRNVYESPLVNRVHSMDRMPAPGYRTRVLWC